MQCRLLHLGEAPLGDPGVRNVVYLARCRIENAQLIARQVKAANQCAPPSISLRNTLIRAHLHACCLAGLFAVMTCHSTCRCTVCVQ